MRTLVLMFALSGCCFSQTAITGATVSNGTLGAVSGFPVGATALPLTFVDPSPPTDTGGTSLDGTGTIGSIVKDWGGAILRSRTTALTLGANGGHGGYGGNQVYQYTITDATTQALTRNNPTIPSFWKCTNHASVCYQSIPATGAPGTCTANGTAAPNATHVYENTGYVAGTSASDDYLLLYGLVYPACDTPVPTTEVWKYTFSSNTWANLGSPTYANSMNSAPRAGTALAKKDDTHFYYWTQDTFVMNFGVYNPSTNTVTRLVNDGSFNSLGQSVGTYDPVHDWVIHAIDYGGGTVRYLRVELSNSNTVTANTVPSPCPSSGALGWDYDPATGKVLVFPNSSVNANTGNTFYLYDASANTCSSWTAPGDSIPTANHDGAGNSNGTFGRLRCGVTINGQTNLCLLLNDYNQAVYVIRTQ